MSDTAVIEAPPRDGLVRAIAEPLELRTGTEGTDTGGPVMAGHFAVFDRWTLIDSIFEGTFYERFSPGAFKKTISEQRDRMRVLFQHGYDPQVGDKPLGPITDLREDDAGAYYEVPLLDAPYVRDQVLPGLEAGLYGASFRFRVVKEDFIDRPRASTRNPDRLPERTVLEAEVREFGPVTFPAYADASAGLRSLTDEFIMLGRFGRDPEKVRSLIEQAGRKPEPSAATTSTVEPEPSAATTPVAARTFTTTEEWLSWISQS